MIQPRYGIALQSLSIQWVDLLEWCHPNPLSSSWKEKVKAYVTLDFSVALTYDELTTILYEPLRLAIIQTSGISCAVL
jgi:hypothetical protein